MSRFKYIRDENNNPVACLAIETQGDMMMIGVSVCHDNDDFHKNLGRRIAEGRLKKHANSDLQDSMVFRSCNIDVAAQILREIHEVVQNVKGEALLLHPKTKQTA